MILDSEFIDSFLQKSKNSFTDYKPEAAQEALDLNLKLQKMIQDKLTKVEEAIDRNSFNAVSIILYLLWYSNN